MPTPSGLPKPGEVWERRFSLPPDWKIQRIRFVVIERGRGDYWSLRVRILQADPPISEYKRDEPRLWVDSAYWFSRGELHFVAAHEDAPTKTESTQPHPYRALTDETLAARLRLAFLEQPRTFRRLDKDDLIREAADRLERVTMRERNAGAER